MIYKIEFSKTKNSMLITADNPKDLHRRILHSYGDHEYIILEQVSEKTIEDKEYPKK